MPDYTKEQHEEAAGMGLEDTFLSHHEQPCDCAVCDDIAFRKSLRQKAQSKHDANCLLRLLLETLPIQLEQRKLTHDRTACAMLIQDSIDYLFRDGEDTLIESPSNDEQQMLKLAYMMGQTTEQKLSEHIRRESNKFEAALRDIVETGDKMSVKYEAVHLVKIAREALGDL